MALIITYLVMITVLRGIDRFRLVVPFIEFRSERVEGGALILDRSALADGRFANLVRAGLFTQRLVVHRSVVNACEADAASSDPAVTLRARRALDGLTELRAIGRPPLDIDETDLPNAAGVNDVLIRLARLEGGRVVTSDPEMTRLAHAEGLAVVDVQAMAATFASAVHPGDTLTVAISKPGEGRNQGIGFLDDGSMVVVNNAADALGKTVACTVLRLHTTANGRMIFAERA
jgi:uncharacterized protein YacL